MPAMALRTAHFRHFCAIIPVFARTTFIRNIQMPGRSATPRLTGCPMPLAAVQCL